MVVFRSWVFFVSAVLSVRGDISNEDLLFAAELDDQCEGGSCSAEFVQLRATKNGVSQIPEEDENRTEVKARGMSMPNDVQAKGPKVWSCHQCENFQGKWKSDFFNAARIEQDGCRGTLSVNWLVNCNVGFCGSHMDTDCK